MAYPSPKWNADRGRWEVDLREPWKLGRHLLDVWERADHIGALHASYALKDALEARRPAGPQLALPATSERRTVADAVAGYLAERDHHFASVEGGRWWRDVARRLVAELGQVELPALSAGVLAAYRDEQRKSIGPKTMQDRLICLAVILRWAVGCGWLAVAPAMPSPKLTDGERIRHPLDKWIAEADFRATRDRIYDDRHAARALATYLRGLGRPADAVAVRDLAERRKLYLSFAFYTGMRKHDLDLLDDRSVSPDLGCYARYTRKTGGARPEMSAAGEAIPARDEQGRAYALLADLEAERARLGRFYRRHEQICGGPWKNVCRVVAEAADRAGVERFNLMDCRRSFVWHKAAAGEEEWRMVALLGHKDSTMIRNVYLQHLPRLQRDKSAATWPQMLGSASPGKLLLLPSQRQNAHEEGP